MQRGKTRGLQNRKSRPAEIPCILSALVAGRLRSRKASAGETRRTATELILYGLTARRAGRRARRRERRGHNDAQTVFKVGNEL